MVFEPDDQNADRKMATSRTKADIKKRKLHLVRFYDNKDYWYADLIATISFAELC